MVFDIIRTTNTIYVIPIVNFRKGNIPKRFKIYTYRIEMFGTLYKYSISFSGFCLDP